MAFNLRVFDVTAEGASEYFRVFSTGTAYYVIIFKFQGAGQLLRLPSPPGAYAHVLTYQSWFHSYKYCKIYLQ